MKESNFINRNLDSWSEYEKILTSKKKNPEKLSQLFIKITDDLSYANTNYRNRSVRVYLNSFAKLLFHRVNQSERFRFLNLRRFFTHSVPHAIYQARREFLISFIVFAISMLIGILSNKNDPEFAKLILGEDYVSMSQANIEKNDPMAVYKSMSPVDMFFGITINNILVALRTFVLGFFMGIGTLLSMIYNGVMVGSFQSFFIERGLFKESFLTIWQHGVLEISSIIMAGAGGLVLGKGLIFPGNYSRFQSLRISARRGLKLLIGVIPVFIVAAFIEGFYTRFTDAPDALRIFTILLSTMFILGYFIVLPYLRNKQEGTENIVNESPVGGPAAETDYSAIHSAPQLFMLSLQELKNNFRKILGWCLLSGMLFPGILLIQSLAGSFPVISGIVNFRPGIFIHTSPWGLAVMILEICILLVLLSGINFGSPLEARTQKGSNRPLLLFRSLIPAGIAFVPLLITSGFFAVLLTLIAGGLFLFIINTLHMERKGFVQAFSVSFVLLRRNIGKFLYLLGSLALISYVFYLVFSLLIASLYTEFVEMNLYGSGETALTILNYVSTYYFSFVILIIISLIYLAFRALYLSLHETYHAENLMSKIARIGKTKKLRGLIRE